MRDGSDAGGGVLAFSVVVPLFNKRPFVRDTVQRILDQDHSVYEVIVVDDGSTDGSAEAIAELVGPRLRIVRQANAGCAAARNAGIALARHPWIAFADADDLWWPDHLGELARLAETFPQAGMLSTAYRKRLNDGTLPPRPPGPGALHTASFFAASQPRNVVCASSVALRRDLLERIGGFSDMARGEDTELWVRAGLETPFGWSSRVTVSYSVHTGGISDALARDGARPESAAFALLERKLADPACASLHADIRTYLDARWLTAARNAAFHGDQVRVREALMRVRRRKGRGYRALAALARLPAPAFAAASAAWRAVSARRARR